jgi:hypothetical protein
MNDHDGNALLARLVSAKHLLEPTKSADYFGYTPETLKETRPVFRGTWVFDDPNAPRIPPSRRPVSVPPPAPGLLVVQISWTDDEDGKYEKGAPHYYRLRDDQPGPFQHIDVKLMEMVE